MISPYVMPGLPRDGRVMPKEYTPVEHSSKCEFTAAVIDGVSKYFGVTELTTRSRKNEFMTPRRYICYLLYKCRSHRYSYSEIGGMIGYYDHATVLHHVRKIGEFIDIKDKQTLIDLKELDLMINYKGGVI